MGQRRQYLSLEEIQQEELHILETFDQFCKDNGLNYSLAYGTLLGAIRHGGFIPWDDDIDVTMPRPDYERLCKCSHSFFETLNLHLIDCRKSQAEAYPSAYAKLVDYSINAKEAFTNYDMEQHLWIDIFPMDAVVPKRKERALKRRLKYYNKMCSIPLAKSRSKMAELAKKGLRTFIRDPFPYARHINEALLSVDFDSSNYVTDYFSWIEGQYVCYKKADILKTVPVTFEGRTFPVISCWEEQLTGIYGDFWTLPPENERISHELKAWRVDE